MTDTARRYLVGLVGEGVRPSLTPPLHERQAAELGLTYTYRPIDLLENGRSPAEIGNLVRAARDLGFDGLNITHPCKQLVIEHLDELTEDAAQIGAVNTVLISGRKLFGHNTDRSGFATGLTAALPHADLSRVVQLGAGGAGAAIAHALLDLGVAELTIVDPDGARAGELANSLCARGSAQIRITTPDGAPAAAEAATGLVNASPIGMHTHPGMPITESALHERLWVADAVYRPIRTPLIEAARALGCATMDGGHMAVGQAIDAFALFTGIRPEPSRMRGLFLDLVAAEQNSTAPRQEIPA